MTRSVIDWAGNVAAMVLAVLPEAGGVMLRTGCATIEAKLVLL
jgi:hypothetical protein